MIKDKVVALIGDPTRPLRGHPPLKGEGSRRAREQAARKDMQPEEFA
jgi:hypothetical protein